MEQPLATFFDAFGKRVVFDTLVGVAFDLVVGLAHRFRDILILTLNHHQRQTIHKADNIGDDKRLGVVGIDTELVDGDE